MENGTYGFDKRFLEENSIAYIELISKEKDSRIIVVPSWQGRVMTSTSAGDNGMSYGWINHNFISKGVESEQFNVYGGEERFWLGPEGGDFSLFFQEGDEQVFENWKVPAFLDTEPYPVVKQTTSEVLFEKRATIINASGNRFDLKINRKVTLLGKKELEDSIGIGTLQNLESVGYISENILTNTGDEEWSKDKGLISIWLLCMFAPSPTTTVFIPFIEDSELSEIPIVNDEYFGKVPKDRLVKKEGMIFFKIDGEYRSKIGIPRGRATNICGSYDASGRVLTIIKFNTPVNSSPYVNSNWGEQEDPFNGDVINSYNDGPVEDGSVMGPFYEIESSSPGAELLPGEHIRHSQQVYHFKGDEAELERITKTWFNLTLSEITSAF